MRVVVSGDESIASVVRAMVARSGQTSGDVVDIEIVRGDGPHVEVDGVDGPLESGVVTHISELARSGSVLLRRRGGVRSDRKLKVWCPIEDAEALGRAIARGCYEFGGTRPRAWWRFWTLLLPIVFSLTGVTASAQVQVQTQVGAGGGGGGGAVTVANGADVNAGATTDAAVITDTTGTMSAKLRAMVKWAFERMPSSLGQKAMTASLPVAIAIDQSAIPVTGAFFQATQPVSIAATITVDSEFAIAAALTDNFANPTTAPVGAFMLNWDGVNWDRWNGSVTLSQYTPVSGRLPVDGSGVTQPVSGTVTANAGTNLNTSALALSATQTDRTQKTQLTDGTRDGTIKAASTAAQATDTSIVVGLSPNSPLPGFASTPTMNVGTFPDNEPFNLAQMNGTALASPIDVDSGAGTQNVQGVSLRKAASGGSVEYGTLSDPLRVDPTGATTQPISAASLPLPTGAATSTIQTDGTQKTRIVDGAGDTVNVTGTSIDVNCTGGCGSPPTFADNSAFTFGTSSVGNIGAVVDDTSPNAVAENSAGAPRMSTRRELYSQIRDAAGNERGVNVTAANALKVDNSAVTQPVSGTVTVQDGGNILDVQQNAAIGTSATLQNAATSTGNGTAITTTGYAELVQTINCVTCAGGTVVTFEGSEDGSNFSSIRATLLSTGTQASFASYGATGAITLWRVPVAGLQQYRARISTYAAGTITISAHALPLSTTPIDLSANLVGNVGITGTVQVNQTQMNSTTVSAGQGISDSGTQRVTLAQELTYAASTAAKTATAAGTASFFEICGSASKTIRIQRIVVSGTVATAAIYGDVQIRKNSAALTGGTATTLTNTPYDANSAAATATVKYFTVLPTGGGTLVGNIFAQTLYFPITGTVATFQPQLLYVWRDQDAEAPTLRGTAQCLAVGFGTTPTNAPTLSVSVAWTEK